MTASLYHLSLITHHFSCNDKRCSVGTKVVEELDEAVDEDKDGFVLF